MGGLPFSEAKAREYKRRGGERKGMRGEAGGEAVIRI